MKLIIGGAYQGKLSYAQKQYQLIDGWIDGRDCPMEAIQTCRGIDHFHEYVKRMLMTDENGESNRDGQSIPYRLRTDHLAKLEPQAAAFVTWLVRQNPNIVIVSNEQGYGVVPMDRHDRLWREAVGRICTCIASEAEEVVRVVCGIGTKLK